MTLLFNYQSSLNRTIEDIDIPKRSLYFSGLHLSCKVFSPGSVSLLSSIAAHLSCKDFSSGFLPLSSPTTGSLNRSFEDIVIPKWIMFFSGFNLSCKDFSPGSASLLSLIAAHLSCKDFFHGCLSLSSPTTGLQFYTNPTGLSPKLPTLLSNYQGSLNRSIDVFDILKWISYFSGFNLIGENFPPGSASLSSLAAAHKCYTSSTSGFNLSCKDFSPDFLSPSSPTTVHQFYTNPTRPSPILLTLLANYQSSSSYTSDDVDILEWILYPSGLELSYKRILYLSDFNTSCKDFSPGFNGVNFNYKDFSPGSALFPSLHISPTSDFNFSCKDSPLEFASRLSLIPANQLHTSLTWLSVILWTLSSNYLDGFNFNCKDFVPDHISISSSIVPQQFQTNGLDFCCKDFSPGLSFSSSLVPPLLLALYRDFILLGPETPQDLYYFEPYFGQA